MTTITTDEGKFNLPEHSNLLETLEKLGYAIEYQCRSGYCGSCRIKLLSGCVSYAQLPMAFCNLMKFCHVAVKYKRTYTSNVASGSLKISSA